MHKPEVEQFSFHLEDHIFQLHEQLKNKEWKPQPYTSFYIRDPKLRNIHKATVRDRVLNQALYRVLYYIFDKTFIFDSYSSRIGKGTHKGVFRLYSYSRKLSHNYTKPVFVLKCDIRKFFEQVSHAILIDLIQAKIQDEDVLWLIRLIVYSFKVRPGCGLPLGNVTSQLFANIYLNEFDQFVKHTLRARYYLRYCDDFIILAVDEMTLKEYLKEISQFLRTKLHLELHPHKVTLRKVSYGVDFLGYVVLPYYIVLRTKTKNRILKKIALLSHWYSAGLITEKDLQQRLNSYLGILTHCRGYKLKKAILDSLAH